MKDQCLVPQLMRCYSRSCPLIQNDLRPVDIPLSLKDMRRPALYMEALSSDFMNVIRLDLSSSARELL
jgi:hypothetical protein